MIPEYKLYHGSVLADIVDLFDGEVSIREQVDAGRLLNYVINGKVGLQIKHATQRLRPWHFSFPASHIAQLEEMRASFAVAFAVLVCRTDGMVAIPADELLPRLVPGTDGQSWLRVNRRKREMYRVSGPTGEFPHRFRTTAESIVEALRGVCSTIVS